MAIPKLRFLLIGAIGAFVGLLLALSVGCLYMQMAFRLGGGK